MIWSAEVFADLEQSPNLGFRLIRHVMRTWILERRALAGHARLIPVPDTCCRFFTA